MGADLHGYGRSSTGLRGNWSQPNNGMTATFVDGPSMGSLETSGLAVSFHRDSSAINANRYFSRKLDVAMNGTMWLS